MLSENNSLIILKTQNNLIPTWAMFLGGIGLPQSHSLCWIWTANQQLHDDSGSLFYNVLPWKYCLGVSLSRNLISAWVEKPLKQRLDHRTLTQSTET